MFLMVVAKASDMCADMAKRRLSANERNGPTSVKTKGCLQLSPEVAMLTLRPLLEVTPQAESFMIRIWYSL